MMCHNHSVTGRRTQQPVRAVTERQAELCAFIAAFDKANGFAPAFSDFMGHFGWTSTNAVADHLEALKEKRLVTFAPKKQRTVRLTASGEEAAQEYRRTHPEMEVRP